MHVRLGGALCQMIRRGAGGIWGAVVRASLHGALCRMIRRGALFIFRLMRGLRRQ